MTIHHDKLAYGRLKGLREELSEDELLAEIRALNEEDGENDDKNCKTDEKSGGECEKTDT